MSTRILFTKPQQKSKHFVQNTEILNTAKVTWRQVVIIQWCNRDRKFLISLNVREELFAFRPKCSASIQLYSLVGCNTQLFAARNNVMSIDAQLAAEQTHICCHRLTVFQKYLQHKCTICCRPELKNWSDKLHVVLRELIPFQ